MSSIEKPTARAVRLSRAKVKPRYDRRMETVELQVEGMDCQGCVKSVTRMLSGVAGVENVEVLLEQGRARITYDPAKSGPAEFKRAIERAGYKAP
jgi:copper chaperone